MPMAENTQLESVSTEFSCTAAAARDVYVAGDFNTWDPTTTALKQNKDGRWVTHLDLPPGRHEYKFVIDGQWCCEPGCSEGTVGCPKCVQNAFGTMNRFVDVA